MALQTIYHPFRSPFPPALATQCEDCGTTLDGSDHLTLQRANGTYAALLPNTSHVDACSHRHGTEAAARGCRTWERNARWRGESKWAPGARYQHGKLVATDPSPEPTAAGSAEPEPEPTVESRFEALRFGDTVTDDDLANSHEYVPMPELADLWAAMVTGSKVRPAGNMLFVGPSGSGKTDGARYLAALVGLPFTKVDAASMTDPESWFGTREIVVEEGHAVTHYHPSSFVESIQKPGVTLIDEVTRVRDDHRNVLLPILDATRSVINPLTGDVIHRHPQNFIIMAGNVGLRFTGTSTIDPAFMTRARTVEFDYIDKDTEERIVAQASGCGEDTAYVLVRFADETRGKAKSDPEFTPISTREIIEAGRLVADGLSRDLAVKFEILNAASGEGGAQSVRQELANLWNGVRTATKPRPAPAAKAPAAPAAASRALGGSSTWTCPTHSQVKVIPAGISKAGKPYAAFRACPVFGCNATEDRMPGSTAAAPTMPTVNGQAIAVYCPSCNTLQPRGRTTICVVCGAALS